MKRYTKNNVKLLGSVKLSATLISSLTSVTGKMSVFPNTERISSGTSLKYVAKEGKKLYIIELGIDAISISAHSEEPIAILKNELMLKLIAVIRILWRDYRFDFEQLMPYLIDSLAMAQIEDYSNKIAKDHENADILLSKRVLCLLNENNRLGKENAEAKALLLKAISFMCSTYPERFNPDSISKGLGIEKSLIFGALSPST